MCLKDTMFIGASVARRRGVLPNRFFVVVSRVFYAQLRSLCARFHVYRGFLVLSAFKALKKLDVGYPLFLDFKFATGFISRRFLSVFIGNQRKNCDHGETAESGRQRRIFISPSIFLSCSTFFFQFCISDSFISWLPNSFFHRCKILVKKPRSWRWRFFLL